jgi:hypothetical protein
MRDAGAGIGGGDGLVDDGRRLRCGRKSFGVERDVAEQQIGIGGLDEIGALQI